MTRISRQTEAFPLRDKRIVATSPSFGKARCEIGWNWNPAPLPDFDLWYVVSGRGELRLGNRAYPLRKGACFLLHPGDRPRAEQEIDDRLTVIFVHFQVEPWGANEELLPERAAYLKETYEFEWLLHRMLDCLYQPRMWAEDEFDGLMKQALLALLRYRAEEESSSAPARKEEDAVRRVIQSIRESGGQRLTREELARQAALSPAYVSRMFKSVVGVSLKEYMTQARLERAVVLLSETTMNVSEVSAALGYSSVFPFSKQFKRRFGVPPSSFMRSSYRSTPHQSSEPDRGG